MTKKLKKEKKTKITFTKLQTKDTSGRTRYKCNFCGKTTVNLIQHMNMHIKKWREEN